MQFVHFSSLVRVFGAQDQQNSRIVLGLKC